MRFLFIYSELHSKLACFMYDVIYKLQQQGVFVNIEVIKLITIPN